MTGQSEQNLFLVTIPDLSELCSVFLSFQNCCDEGELRNKQLKTCRELLLLCPDLIAAPVFGSFGGISVIMAIPFFKKGFIQAYAQRHSIQLGSPQKVLPETLQICLSNSITARLAPHWNKAGQYLIAGKDFLSEAGKLLAVVLEMSVNQTELCVSVEANTVRLPPASLQDFEVPPPVVRKFLSSRDAVLHTSLPNNWCYILPSMKKGQIISISRRIPEESPFQTYAELQSHWNSLYGYHLPTLTEDEEIYCSVYFKLVGQKLFTYPLSCIRTQPVQCFPRVDLQGALGVFMSDLSSQLKTICGFSVQITNKPYYHNTTLSRPFSQVSGAPPANLTTNTSSRLVLTQLPSGCAPGRVSLSQSTPSEWPLSQPGCFRQTTPTREMDKIQTPSFSSDPSHCYRTKASTFLPPSSSSFLSFSHPSPTLAQPGAPTPKLVPIFKNKSLTPHVNITKLLAEKQQQKQAEMQKSLHVSGPAVIRPHPSSSSSTPPSFSPSFTPSISRPPLQRVTLPFSKNLKRGCETSVPEPTQPITRPEIKVNQAEQVFKSHPKKQKANIQDVDVVKLAKSNQLAKINTVTLHAWLKAKGVSVRAKDRKEVLVSKVMQCLYEP